MAQTGGFPWHPPVFFESCTGDIGIPRPTRQPPAVASRSEAVELIITARIGIVNVIGVSTAVAISTSDVESTMSVITIVIPTVAVGLATTGTGDGLAVPVPIMVVVVLLFVAMFHDESCNPIGRK